MIASAGELGNELSAWDALSDEALETVDAMTKRYFTNSSWPGCGDSGTEPLDSNTVPIEAGDLLPDERIRYWPEAKPTNETEQRIKQLEDGLKSLAGQLARLEERVKDESIIASNRRASLVRRLDKLEHQVKTGLADAGQRLGRLEYVVNELDDERSKTEV